MASEGPVYRDPTAETGARVADLRGRMTREEKLGQLAAEISADADEIAAAIESHAIGAAAPFGHSSSPYDTPESAARVANRLQQVATERTRLGVPLLLFVDAVHGHARIKGSTVFPHNLGLAATRDPELVEAVGRVTAAEVAATGAQQTNDPVADVARDPRWGRTFETFGESPWLCGELVAAKVRGYTRTSDDVAVAPTVKHFPAYSQPIRGQDAAPVEASERTLDRVFLPPFRAAVDADVPAMMPSYSAVNTEPVHGSRRYLHTLLREKVGFEGCVVSDWGGIGMLADDHGTAPSRSAAALQGFDAGIDLATAGGPAYVEALVAAAEAGDIDDTAIDRRVSRLLTLKFELGLFEDPFVEVERARSRMIDGDRRAIARRAARESVTLLRNEGLLPLSDALDEVILTGPNADHPTNQLGGWTSADYPADEVVTIRDGLTELAPTGTTVRYEPAVDSDDLGADLGGADAAVVVLGEPAYIHEFSLPSGAARDLHESTGDTDRLAFPTRSSLELPERQRALVWTIAERDIPVAVVIVGGRPLILDPILDHAEGILMTYYPGIEGGGAVAEVLFGEHNPSGKLPISFPQRDGNLPELFDHYPHPLTAGSDAQPGSYEPRYPYGHGLSYTVFEHELAVDPPRLDPEDSLEATVTVTNAGDRAGTATVDCFLADEDLPVLTPVRRHVGMTRLDLDAGATDSSTISIPPGTLALDGDVPRRGRYRLTVADRTESFEIV